MTRPGLASVMALVSVMGCNALAPSGDFRVDGSTDASAADVLPGDDANSADDASVDASTDGGTKPGDVPTLSDVTKSDDVPLTPDATADDVPLTPDDVPVTPDDVPVTPDDVPVTPDDVPVTPDDVPTPPVDVPTPPIDVPVTPIDVPTPPIDVPTPPIDVPVTPIDVPTPPVDVPPRVDVPPVDPCVAPVNLNTAGTLSGSVLRYSGNNVGTAEDTAYDGRCGMPGHVRALSYTTRTRTRLQVSTDNPGTPNNFDTVVFALDRCAATGVSVLGCDDDANGTPRGRSSDFTTAALPAGTTVFIFVGGYVPPTSAMWTATGAFELSVTELPPLPVVAVGGACDSTGATNQCVTGSSCRLSAGSYRCAADGTLGASCRAAAPRCDSSLECNATTLLCQGAPGTNGGACRLSANPCDAGLGCSPTSSPLCRPLVADGATCDPTSVANVCRGAAQCISAAGSATCRRFFTETAIPSPTFLDACTGGTRLALASATSRDDTHAAAYTIIPWTFSFFGAPQRFIWPTTNGFLHFGPTAPANNLGGHAAIPDTAAGPVIAPLWDDLVLRASPVSDLCVATLGATPDRRVVVEWLDAYRYGANESHITMEVILYERGSVIDFIYNRLEAPAGSATSVDGSRAAVGLQNADGVLYVVHPGTVSTASGIRFTPL